MCVYAKSLTAMNHLYKITHQILYSQQILSMSYYILNSRNVNYWKLLLIGKNCYVKVWIMVLNEPEESVQPWALFCSLMLAVSMSAQGGEFLYLM